MSLVGDILSTPQNAAALIVGAMAAIIHYGCGMYNRKRCEPGRLLIFVVSAGSMVAGVYIFVDALKSALSETPSTVSHPNAVLAGLAGACIALFTLDFMIDELKQLWTKPPVKPEIRQEPPQN